MAQPVTSNAGALTTLKDYILPPVVTTSKGAKNLLTSIQKIWHEVAPQGGAPSVVDSKSFGQAIGGLKCGALINLPLVAYSIYKAGEDFAVRPGLEQGIDSGLSLGGGVSDLLDVAASVGSGVKDITGLSEAAFSWITPVSAVAIGLSVCHVIAQARQALQTHQFYRKFKGEFLDHLTEDPTKALNYLRIGGDGPTELGKKEWSKFLVTNGERTQTIIKNFLEEAVARSTPQKREKLGILQKALAKRIKQKGFAHKLAITSAVVAIVASIVLMTIGGGWIFYPLLFLAAAISLAKFIYDKKATAELNKVLRSLELSTPMKIALPAIEVPAYDKYKSHPNDRQVQA
jgi:hypothetical protein